MGENVAPLASGELDDPYQPFYRNEKYPRGLRVDFRKLQYRSLQAYIKRHDLKVRSDSTKEELAIAVGRHFENQKVNEEGIICAFVEKYVKPVSAKLFDATKKAHAARSTSAIVPVREPHQTSIAMVGAPLENREAAASAPIKKPKQSMPKKVASSSSSSKKEDKASRKRRASTSGGAVGAGKAKPGEQVAVLSEADEEDAWILARVVEYDGFTDEYNCKDEDDMDSKLIRVESDKIIRLDETLQGVEIGDNVLAVFPDTTSFYRAVVQKIVKAGHTSEKSVEVVVKFADDEDESGITPGRKVPARYVMPQPRRESAKSKRARQ